MSGLFITSSGTGIGKTFVTAAMCHQLRARGDAVRAWKPVVSGLTEETLHESDPGMLLRAMGQEVTENAVARISPWRFRAALSPDMAARMEGGAVALDALVAWCRERETEGGITLVEGVGGCMVPLNDRDTVLDWMKALGWPVVMVGGSYLGAMSHLLTACKVVRDGGGRIARVVVSETPGSEVSLDETVSSLKNYIPEPVITLPYQQGQDGWKTTPDLLSNWL